ncbi:Threonine/homoserine efflux transporter RhtA [Asanoa hainanensis]|uniref:Threonine/homoserine efflux transporter RhtA n=2 Tax=Asanoa hainanensis TaxID=560556 RepID=A0A239P2M2_9ACTN|nr:Threonine/homoserine efflux transporter RhtA [Asanoa hainanensis]
MPRPALDPAASMALVVAVLAVSTSGPLIAFATAAPALAIAFWRNALAVGVLGPISLFARRAEYANLARREAAFCVLAGVALAAHFAAWMPSIRFTTVAASTALVATQPVWQGLISVAQGRRLRTVTWAGIGVAVLGAVLATGADFGVSSRAVLGDLLAVLGAMMAAAYTAFGERARVTLSTTTYTTICYSVCAVLLLVICVASGQSLGGYPATTWLAILGLVAGAQLLGHTMFNYALRRVSATTISVLILLEVPGAGLIAWLWLDQVPPAESLAGLALLMVGVLIVVLGGAHAGRRARALEVETAGTLP